MRSKIQVYLACSKQNEMIHFMRCAISNEQCDNQEDVSRIYYDHTVDSQITS